MKDMTVKTVEEPKQQGNDAAKDTLPIT